MTPARSMKITLPTIKKTTRKILVKAPYAFTSSTTPSRTQTHWSYVTLSLAIFCLSLVILIGTHNGFGFISPVSSFLNPRTLFSQDDKTYQVFGYIPGWSQAKYDHVNFSGFDMLAFYDLPVAPDGNFYEDTKGYTQFKSQEAQDLFQRAKANGVKIIVSISQTSTVSIEKLLDDPEAQQVLIENTSREIEEAGIDGVVIDFNYEDEQTAYTQKYTDFVSLFKQSLSGKEVHVAVNTEVAEQSFYDITNLAAIADTLMISMDHLALLEERDSEISAPFYTYNEEAYWEDMGNALGDVSTLFEQNNIALEKAWYGNGEEYPMYKPVMGKTIPTSSPQTNTLSTPLSDELIDQLVSEVPTKAKESARKNLPLIARALEQEGVLTANVLSYALATIEHETAGTFEPIDEIKGEKSARRLGYEGGTNYYGRGFIQLTHLRNYKAFGMRIGMGDQLARNPDLASDPEVAAKILAAFFVDNGPARLARQGDFIAARRPVNPDAQAYSIANIAMKYRYTL